MNKIPDKYSTINSCPDYSLTSWESNGKFIFRYDAEYDDSILQLIPYTVIFNKNADKVYVGKRIAGDTRLVHQYSIGFGGHINPVDAKSSLGSIILDAAERELNEEVNLINRQKLEWQGYVRDITSNTSEHIGFVFTVKCSRAKIKEKDSLEGEWMTIDDMVKKYSSFERWSQYIIDSMFLQYKATGNLLYANAIISDHMSATPT